MTRQADNEAPGVSDLMARLVDGVGELLAQHVALARLEVGDELHSVARVLGTLAVVTPAVVVGYAMLCLALAFTLVPLLSLPGAVALVGAANLVGGGLALWSVRKTLQRQPLQQTAQAVRESASLLATEAREVSGVH